LDYSEVFDVVMYQSTNTNELWECTDDGREIGLVAATDIRAVRNLRSCVTGIDNRVCASMTLLLLNMMKTGIDGMFQLHTRPAHPATLFVRVLAIHFRRRKYNTAVHTSTMLRVCFSLLERQGC
jgi:hypothetical protein